MNNLDKMKQLICNQIQEMDAATFYEFTSQIEELIEHDDFSIISLSEAFSCKKCKELYGHCNDESEDRCEKRYEKYCEQEV